MAKAHKHYVLSAQELLNLSVACASVPGLVTDLIMKDRISLDDLVEFAEDFTVLEANVKSCGGWNENGNPDYESVLANSIYKRFKISE